MLRIDARSSRELQAAILGVRRARKEFQADIRKWSKDLIAPEWNKGLAEHASTRLEHKALVASSRVSVSNQNIKLKSASLQGKLSGGLKPADTWYAIEYGADVAKKTTYEATSKNGKKYSVTRRTSAQLRPRRRGGYVIEPTVTDLLPRIASLWVQTVIRRFMDGIEGKS
ncbi:hypothetical protein VD659_16215 [Herbiconiux sp. 11R-BC]|uniref:hypothetical protein n=1 Tax=Herbiconiux sp. 11R-BC TaxID=3111637 RepID=UPI003C0DEE03